MTTQELLERVKADPRTTWAAWLLGAVFAGGEYLHQASVEPWGSMLLGLSGFGSFACLIFARFAKPAAEEKKNLPPPEAPQ